jgi:hypothetical protein
MIATLKGDNMELDSETISAIAKGYGRQIQNLVNLGIKEAIGIDDKLSKSNGLNSILTICDDFLLTEELMESCNEKLSFQETIPNLKKRIKYCKNPMEKKRLEKELNGLYKENKRR